MQNTMITLHNSVLNKGRKLIFLIVSLSMFSVCTNAQYLKTYNPPEEALPSNSTFTVQARTAGGEWKSLRNCDVKIFSKTSTYPTNIIPNHASMVYLSFSGTVEFKVTYNAGNINSYLIRPDSFNIRAIKKKNTLTFKVKQNNSFPRKFVLIINNNLDECLHILSNPPEFNAPRPTSPEVFAIQPGTQVSPLPPGKTIYYFMPGMHILDNQLVLKSNQQVYIDGSAVVMGGVRGSLNATGVKISGRGILDGAQLEHNMLKQRYTFINFVTCSQVSLEGFIVLDPPAWGIDLGCPDSKITNVSEIGYNWNSDGLWLNGADRSVASGLFIRSADDIICCHSGKDITVQNCVLWGDKAHIIFMGIKHATVSNIKFSNIDVIGHRETDPNFEGVMAIQSANGSVIKNITFQNITISPFREPNFAKVIFISLNTVHQWAANPGDSINNIVFRNIHYEGTSEQASQILGYSDDHPVNGIHIYNYTRGTHAVGSLLNSNIKTGPFVKSLLFNN